MTSPAPRPHGSSALRGDIEGLRAIAVTMVLLYHAALPGMSGGFAGVDVFFVISGYLITNLLVKEVGRTGTISIPMFYARRARRLLPAATLVLVFTAVAGALLLPRARWAELGGDVVAAALYVVNWALAFRSVDYLAEDSAPSLVQHYWSLSVEEQFYVVWPLLMIVGALVARRMGWSFLRVVTVMLLVLLLSSLAWSVSHTASSPATAYFVTTTRAWELAIGALLVPLTPALHRLPRRLAGPAALLGVAMIVLTLLTLSTRTPWPGSAALLPTVGTALVIAAGLVVPENAVARVLGVRPMRFLGGISYGLYLWHWPLLQLLHQLRPDAGLPLRVGVVLLSVLLAWGTLHLVENPVRFNRRLAGSARPGLVGGAVAMTVSIAVGVAVLQSAPRLVTELPQQAVGALALVDRPTGADGRPEVIGDPRSAYTRTGTLYPHPAIALEDVPPAYDQGCQVDQPVTEIVAEDACWYGDPDGSSLVAVVGDSKMLQWLPALEPIAQQEGWRVKVYTKSACAYGEVDEDYPECTEYNDRLEQELLGDEHRPDLLLTSMGGQPEPADVAARLARLQDAGVQIGLIADNPGPRRGVFGGSLTSYECLDENPDDYLACTWPTTTPDGVGTTTLRAVADELGVPLVDINPFICPTPEGCPSAVGEMTLFRQGTHLTVTYARSLSPLLHEALTEAGLARTPASAISWEVPPPSAQG